jgi:hypothetical protein
MGKYGSLLKEANAIHTRGKSEIPTYRITVA